MKGDVDSELTGLVGEFVPFDGCAPLGGTHAEGLFEDVAGSASRRVGGGVEDGEVAGEGAVAVGQMG